MWSNVDIFCLVMEEVGPQLRVLVYIWLTIIHCGAGVAQAVLCLTTGWTIRV
jgi:hypothetical protein